MPRTIARALAEHLAHLGVDHEIDVALAVARLDVGQAVPLVGQRAQRLRRRSTAAWRGSTARRACVQNAGPSATTMSPASSCGSMCGEVVRREVIDVEEQLQIAACVSRIGTNTVLPMPRLAITRPATRKVVAVDRRDAASAGRRDAGFGRARSARGRSASAIVGRDVVAIRIGAGGAQRRGLVAPLADDAVEGLLRVGRLVCHGGAPYTPWRGITHASHVTAC